MPWYEPACRAPPTPMFYSNDNGESEWNDGQANGNGGFGRTHNCYDQGEVVDVQSFMNPNWNYSYRDTFSSNNQRDQQSHIRRGDCLNFDGVQHRVESQLSSVFPLADFSSHDHVQNNFLSRQPSLYQYEESNDSAMRYESNSMEGGGSEKYGQDQNEHPNLKTEEGTGKIVSKAAQFFHPRPVMALMPYQHFFSPLQFPTDGEPETKVVEEQKLPPKNDLEADGNAAHDSSLASHHSQAPPQGYAQQEQQTPARHRDSKSSNALQTSHGSRNSPTSNLKPKNLFDNFIAGTSNGSFKQPPKQTKLVRDSKTGQMTAELNSSTDATKHGEKKRAKTWDSYGGRPIDSEGTKDSSKEKAKTKKKEKKKKKKDKKQPKQGESDIGALLTQGKKRPSHDSKEGDRGTNDMRKSEASKPAKKHKRDRSLSNSGTELEIPSYELEDVVKPKTSAPSLSEKDFDGIEQMELQNAAQCMEGLEQFLAQVGRQKHVSFTMLFLDPYTGNYTTSATNGDGGGGRGKKKRAARSKKFSQPNSNQGYECTTPFLPTSKKYCTPKGDRCSAWNCTCDDQIRAMRGSATLLGAMFVFQDRDGGGEDDGGKWQCYLLPLGPTDNSGSTQPEVEYPRMSNWPVIPFHCDVSLSDRWRAFEALLFNGSTKLVTYNATVSLLPFYHHLANDVTYQTRNGCSTSIQFDACLACKSMEMVDNQSQLASRRNYGYLSSIWDLRLVAWMMRTEVTDAELEFSTFQEGFSHLVPNQGGPTAEMPAIVQGLTEAKNQLELIHKLYPILNQQLGSQGLLDALEYIESPFQSILASMENQGIGFYPHRLKDYQSDIEDRLRKLENQSRSIARDPDFMLSSPQQVSNLLFDVLKLSIPAGLISKTKAGSSHRSTSEETLKAIKGEMTNHTGPSSKIIDIILEYRGLNKLLTTYIRPLPNFCKRATGKKRSKKNKLFRIHPQWMQATVRTGRLSCRKPNLQQVPKEKVHGIAIRNAFVAEDGMCLFACDYSQKEVRILAHMSGDKNLINLFRGDPNIDIYKQMSSLIRNKPVQDVSNTERAQFKQVTIAILYGMGVGQVAKNLSITNADAQKMMNDFYRRFRRLKEWMDETKAYARENLCVKTISGRKRYLDDINSNDNAKKSQAERQAVNSVIQGSAADLMKTAMINMATNLMDWPETGTGVNTRPRMLLQIHDEAVLEVNMDEVAIKRLKSIAIKSCCDDCQKFFRLKVPLLLTCSAGQSWGAMKEDI